MDTQIDSLDHITIITNNIESTMNFYVKILGLSEDESRPPFKFNGAWLSANNRAIVHIVENNNHVYENQKPTLDHIAFRVLDIEKMKNILNKNTIDFIEQKTPDGKVHQLFIKDPNGIKIELSKNI